MKKRMWMLILLLSIAQIFSNETLAGVPSFKRVMIVIFENAKYSDAISQPFFSKLANQGALFTQFLAESHPSQPNYVALVSGSTQGIKNDSPVNLNVNHIGNLLEQKKLSWKVYAENLPSDCFLGVAQGRYARKHVPFYSFTNVQNDPVECSKIVNATELQKDLAANSLPEFSLYVPNLDNDGHDTGAAYASQWFETTFSPILNNTAFMKDTLVIATFDESDNYKGINQIYTVFLGANVIPGSKVSAQTTHYSILRTIEDAFGLGTLGQNDSTSAGVQGIWQ
eukprot:Pompholyxophrys_sp_v1_NODE_130_length_1697_cov_1.951279.p1 type:complete len:282 gc:universal NODE_130_length_1697_cov_1.951279:590-1435(+)